jgi:hypothetical protein
MTEIELWLKQDGKIEEIVDHEVFSEKIKRNPRKWYNVVILRGHTLIMYATEWQDAEEKFSYQALFAKVSQVETAIHVAKTLLSLK